MSYHHPLCGEAQIDWFCKMSARLLIHREEPAIAFYRLLIGKPLHLSGQDRL